MFITVYQEVHRSFVGSREGKERTSEHLLTSSQPIRSRTLFLLGRPCWTQDKVREDLCPVGSSETGSLSILEGPIFGPVRRKIPESRHHVRPVRVCYEVSQTLRKDSEPSDRIVLRLGRHQGNIDRRSLFNRSTLNII